MVIAHIQPITRFVRGIVVSTVGVLLLCILFLLMDSFSSSEGWSKISQATVVVAGALAKPIASAISTYSHPAAVQEDKQYLEMITLQVIDRHLADRNWPLSEQFMSPFAERQRLLA